MDLRFDRRSALVTGGNMGIGYAVAKAFSKAGADVHILSESKSVFEAAGTLTAETGHMVEGIICDITDRAAVEATAAALPFIDVLVNNAGLEGLTWIDDGASEVFATVERILRINVTGTWSLTEAVIPKLKRGGSIICTASIWSRTAEAGFSAYAASKHATLGLVRAWAKELAPRGIRVNAVAPGWVRTEGALRSLDNLVTLTGETKEALLEKVTSAQALPGFIEPDDVSGAYLFLASELASSITGQSIQVDRGAFSA